MCHTSPHPPDQIKKINYPSTLLQWTKHKIFSHLLTPPLFLNQTKARGCFNIMYRTSKPLIKCLIRILIRYTRSHLFKDNPKQRHKRKKQIAETYNNQELMGNKQRYHHLLMFTHCKTRHENQEHEDEHSHKRSHDRPAYPLTKPIKPQANGHPIRSLIPIMSHRNNSCRRGRCCSSQSKNNLQPLFNHMLHHPTWCIHIYKYINVCLVSLVVIKAHSVKDKQKKAWPNCMWSNETDQCED